MKNITKIITVTILCASLFASAQRIAALGGTAAFWPGDEANIGAFPAQINNHAYTQFTGVGDAGVGVDLVFNHNGTAWSLGFTEDNQNTWFDLGWGKNGMGINVKMNGSEICTDGDCTATTESSGFVFSYGNSFDWGELGVSYVSGTNTAADGTESDWDGTGGDANNGIAVNFRNAKACWIFTDMVASVSMPDEGDMNLTADWFTHWDASGADVMFAMGLDYMDGDAGYVKQTATIGVEASLSDWATFRGGHTWDYTVSSEADATGAGAGSWNMGVGFNWGGFTADFGLGDAFFADPIGYMTGYEGTDWGTATLTYSF